MTTIRVKENEPFDVALRRFKRTIEKLGLLTDLRAREFYEKPTAERKRKKAAAVKRHFKRVRSMQLPLIVKQGVYLFLDVVFLSKFLRFFFVLFCRPQ